MQTRNNKKLADIRSIQITDHTRHDDDFLDAARYCYADILNTSRYADIIGKMKTRVNIPIMIDRVIFNDPATIIIWNDGTKTVVKKSADDIWDPEKGFCMAVIKKLYGNTRFIKNFIETD